MQSFIPKELRMASTKLEGYARNSFKIMSQGADEANPNSIITFTLPEGILALRSFQLSCDVLTTAVKLESTTATTSGAGFVYGKMGDVSASLFSNIEIFIGGVQISQGTSEYSSICHMLKLVKGNRDFDGSISNTLHHSNLDSTDSVDDISVLWKPQEGFFSSSSASFLPSQLTGVLTVRLTVSGPNVLAIKQGGVPYDSDLVAVTAVAADAGANPPVLAVTASTVAEVRAAAAKVTFKLTNIFATIDSIQLDGLENMYLDRLSTEPFLPINYPEFYSYSLTNQSGAFTLKMNQSASSINKAFVGLRDSNYNEVGIRTRKTEGVSTDSHVPNYFTFKSFNSETTKRGTMRTTFSINSVKHPQFDADVLYSASQLQYMEDKHELHKTGNMITSLKHYQSSAAIFPLCLSMPGTSQEVISGADSRGSNTSIDFETKALTMPAANTASQITANLTAFAVIETNQQLRIGGSRQLAIAH